MLWASIGRFQAECEICLLQPEIQLGGSQWYSWLQSCWLRRSLLRAYYAGECPHSPGRISCLSPSISRGSWVLELCANIGWNYAVHVAEKYGKFEPKPWWALSGTQMEPSKNIWAVSKSQIGVKTVVPPSWTARGSACMNWRLFFHGFIHSRVEVAPG